MNIELRLPAHPQTLIELSDMLSRPDLNLGDVSPLIEKDLSLAAAVMNTVSSPLYGLKGRVQSVQQAVTFLGTRELAAIVYECGLREAFPKTPELHALWERARLRGLLMGRVAQALSMDAWSAHTAGLFEESGKAVLYSNAPDQYLPLLRSAANDGALMQAEQAAFGIDHAEVGARLCEQWGLPPGTVNSVRHHVTVHLTHRLPPVSHRYVCVLSTLADTLMTAPDQLEQVVSKIAPQAMMDQTFLLRSLHKVKDKLDDAQADG